MKVLILALGAVRPAAAAKDAALVIEQGGTVTIVTSYPRAIPALDGMPEGAATVVDLTAEAERHPVRRIERAVVYRGPRVVNRGLRKVSRRASLIRGLSRPARLMYRMSQAADRLHRRGTVGFEKSVGSRIRPVLLRQSAGRALMRRVDIAAYDLVVVSDPRSLVTAWHIARRYPQVPVRLRMPGKLPKELASASRGGDAAA